MSSYVDITNYGALTVHELNIAKLSGTGLTKNGAPVTEVEVDFASMRLGVTSVAELGHLNVHQPYLTVDAGSTQNRAGSILFETKESGVTKLGKLIHGTTGNFEFRQDNAFAPVKMKELRLMATDAADQPTENGDFIIVSRYGHLEFQTSSDGTFMQFNPPGSGLNIGSTTAEVIISRPTRFTSTVVLPPSSLTGFMPYTGAVNNMDVGTYSIGTSSVPSSSNHVTNKAYVDAADAVQQAALQTYTNSQVTPGSVVMDKVLSQYVSTVLLDFNVYAGSTFVQGAVADGAWPIANTQHAAAAGGWRYCNDATTYPGIRNLAVSNYSAKINWYFFNNSSKTAVQYQSQRLRTMYMRLRFHKASAVTNTNRPFFAVYSVPLGAGQGDAAAWYRSRKVFTQAASTVPQDQDVVLYVGTDPRQCGFQGLIADSFVQVTFNPADYQSFIGPAGQTDFTATEVLSMISVNTSSSNTTGNTDFTLHEVGYRFGPLMTRVATFF